MASRVIYSAEIDAVFVRLSDQPKARREALDDNRMLEYAADGTLIGVEFQDAWHGLSLAGLAQAAEIEALLREAKVPFEISF